MKPLAARHLFGQNSNKPTIVFIPDFFHTAAHYGPLSRYLETKDYDSFALRLPSIGERAGTSTAGMSEDVATVRRVLEALVREEEDVVLVMHSYGAVPGCQAVQGLGSARRSQEGKRCGIVSLVLVGGLLVEEGESIESTLLGLGEKGLPEYAKKETRTIRPTNTPSLLFSDLPPPKAAYCDSHLEPQSASILTAIMPKTSWGSDIPVTYIHCTQDPKAKIIEAMLTKAKRKNWTIKTIEAGHNPFLSHPEELGEMIMQEGKIGRSGSMG